MYPTPSPNAAPLAEAFAMEPAERITRVLVERGNGSVIELRPTGARDRADVTIKTGLAQGSRLATNVRLDLTLADDGRTFDDEPAWTRYERAQVSVEALPRPEPARRDSVDYRLMHADMPTLLFVVTESVPQTASHVVTSWPAGTDTPVPEGRRARAMLRALLQVAHEELDAAEANDHPDNAPGTTTGRSTHA